MKLNGDDEILGAMKKKPPRDSKIVRAQHPNKLGLIEAVRATVPKAPESYSNQLLINACEPMTFDRLSIQWPLGCHVMP